MLQLEDIIGRGGFGTVYRGTLQTDDGLIRRVAVKVMSEEMSEDLRAVSRLRDEARLLALLEHPSLVPVYALQTVDHRWAVVMGLVEGVDLRKLVTHVAELPPMAACEVAIGVADALAACWDQPHPESGEPLRLVHRDIKPHNVMVDRNGGVRLLDLGVASARFEARESATRDGVAGTLRYMSPQRWARENDRDRGDVYALGATLYYTLTTHLPPEAGRTREEHTQRIEDAIGTLPESASALADPLRAALAFDLSQRPTAMELAAMLRQANRTLPAPGLNEFARAVVAEMVADPPQRGQYSGESLLGTSWDFSTSGSSDDDDLSTGWIFESEPPAADLLSPAPTSGRPRVGVGLAVGAALLAFGGLALVSMPQGPPIRLVAPPVNAPDVMRDALGPLVSHLAAETGRPLELRVTDTYSETNEIFTTGGADIALLTPMLYVQARSTAPVRSLAMTDPVVMSGHEGVLLVAPEIVDLAELRGGTLCFTDPNSTSGYLLPRRYLRKHGLVPERDYSTHLSGGHSQVVKDVAEGVCKAGGTYGNAYSDAARRGETRGAQVFARTGLAAHNTVACSNRTPPEACEALREALLTFRPDAAGSDAFRINGFVEHDPAVFADLIEAHAEETGQAP